MAHVGSSSMSVHKVDKLTAFAGKHPVNTDAGPEETYEGEKMPSHECALCFVKSIPSGSLAFRNDIPTSFSSPG